MDGIPWLEMLQWQEAYAATRSEEERAVMLAARPFGKHATTSQTVHLHRVEPGDEHPRPTLEPPPGANLVQRFLPRRLGRMLHGQTSGMQQRLNAPFVGATLDGAEPSASSRPRRSSQPAKRSPGGRHPSPNR